MSEHGMDDGVDAPLDDDVQARLTAALSGTGPMPEDVWRRLESALSDESAARRAAGAAMPVAATATGTEPIPLAPRRRRTPLLAGLVAAAAAVVAVAAITPQLTGAGGELVATGAAPAASPELMAVEAAPPEDAAPLAAAPPADAAAKAAPSPVTAEAAPIASMRSRPDAPLPARQVMRSGTDYTADTIDQAVMTLVDTVDASHARLMSSVTQEPDPTEGDTGFTATVEGLAGCLRALTAAADRQALLVDRATFQGTDVGIVVVPVGLAASDHSMPFQQIDIWVVTPDCGTSVDPVVWHGTLALP